MLLILLLIHFTILSFKNVQKQISYNLPLKVFSDIMECIFKPLENDITNFLTREIDTLV